MGNPVLHLHIIGWILLLISLIHVGFPRQFKWKITLAELDLVNRQLMYVHTFFVAVVVFLNGLLFIFCAEELTSPGRLPRFINIGLLAFWGLRWLFQHVVYSRKLWMGKRFETLMHVLFTLFWTYIVAILIFILVRL